MIQCKFCVRLFKNAGGHAAHESFCENNPTRVKRTTKNYTELRISQWLNEGIGWSGQTPNWVIRYLSENHGYKCNECGLTEWRNKPIVLELEHKDGNSENNEFENLCLICPNCHSQTDTYKGKNRGNGRHARRKRYAEGKSF